MKRITLFLPAFMLLMAFPSCNKTIPVRSNFPSPLTGDNQVAEFHNDEFDSFFPDPPYFFRKSFDASGKTVKEIVFSFYDQLGVGDIPNDTYDMLVRSKGRVVYLIRNGATDGGPADTAVRVYLNSEGRPDSSIGNTDFIGDAATGAAEDDYLYYKDNRFFAIKEVLSYDDFKTISYTRTDTMKYDSHGNPLAFRGNTYAYDYSKTVTLQFLCDDYTGGDDPFYLLQYLGYFPELTSPVNLRTGVGDITLPPGVMAGEFSQQFDKEGRLIKYGHNGWNTITWNK